MKMAQYLEGKEYPGSYGGYLGLHFSPILEIPLLVGSIAISDEKVVELLAAWQRGPWGLSMIGPHFGLSQDYDHFIIGSAPLVYAVAAVLCRNNKLTKAWIVKELDALRDGEEKAGIGITYTTAARIWLLVITASTIRDFSSYGPSWPEADLYEIYGRIQASLYLAKVPLDLIRMPPSPSELVGEDADPLPIGELSAPATSSPTNSASRCTRSTTPTSSPGCAARRDCRRSGCTTLAAP
jgi:hypothetical protein